MPDYDDERPEDGGEYFSPSGLRERDYTPCFVCGDHSDQLRNRLSGWVDTDEIGRRIVAMFGYGAEFFPATGSNSAKVNIGACATHQRNLDHLRYLITIGYTITLEKIAAARKFKGANS